MGDPNPYPPYMLNFKTEINTTSPVEGPHTESVALAQPSANLKVTVTHQGRSPDGGPNLLITITRE